MSYCFVNLLILIYFEKWKQFNYLFFPQETCGQKKKAFGINKLDYTVQISGLCNVLFQVVSQILLGMTNKSCKGIQDKYLKYLSVQRDSRTAKKEKRKVLQSRDDNQYLQSSRGIKHLL